MADCLSSAHSQIRLHVMTSSSYDSQTVTLVAQNELKTPTQILKAAETYGQVHKALHYHQAQ
jgi:hypothetical protein